MINRVLLRKIKNTIVTTALLLSISVQAVAPLSVAYATGGGSIASGSPATTPGIHSGSGDDPNQVGALYNHTVLGFRVYFQDFDDIDPRIGHRKLRGYLPKGDTENTTYDQFLPIYVLNEFSVSPDKRGNSPLETARITSTGHTLGGGNAPINNSTLSQFVMLDISKYAFAPTGANSGTIARRAWTTVGENQKFKLYSGGNTMLDEMINNTSQSFNTGLLWQVGNAHYYLSYLYFHNQSGFQSAMWYKAASAPLLYTNWSGMAQWASESGVIRNLTGCSNELGSGGEIFNNFVKENKWNSADKMNELMNFICEQYGVDRETVYPGDIEDYVIIFEPVFTAFHNGSKDNDIQVRNKAFLVTATDYAYYCALGDNPAKVLRESFPRPADGTLRSPVNDNKNNVTGYAKTAKNLLNILQPSDVAGESDHGGCAIIYCETPPEEELGVYAEFDINFYTDDSTGLTQVSYTSSGEPGVVIRNMGDYPYLASASHNIIANAYIATDNEDLQKMLEAPKTEEECAFKFFQDWFYENLTWEDYIYELVCAPNRQKHYVLSL